MAFHKYASDDEIISDKLPNAGNAPETEIIARLNEAVSAFVDVYTKRPNGYFLPAAATATVRRFRGSDKNYLMLPVHVFGSVSVTGIAPTAFYESPNNGWLYASDINSNSETDYFDSMDRFFSRRKVYEVFAKWGYEETPAPIIEAVKQIAGRLYDAGQGILGETSPNGFVIERAAPPSALLLLNQYVKNEYEPT